MVLEARLPLDHFPVGTWGGAVPFLVVSANGDSPALSPGSLSEVFYLALLSITHDKTIGDNRKRLYHEMGTKKGKSTPTSSEALLP